MRIASVTLDHPTTAGITSALTPLLQEGNATADTNPATPDLYLPAHRQKATLNRELRRTFGVLSLGIAGQVSR